MNRGAVGRILLGALCLLAVPLAAQEADLTPVPIRLELQLIDRTGMFESSPQHGAGAPPLAEEHLLAGAAVEVVSFTPSAEEEVTRGSTDAEGRIVLDLGPRVIGNPYRLSATLPDGRRYLAKPQPMSSGAGQMFLYRATNDHSTLQQLVIRIATVAEKSDEEEGQGTIQVRQLIQCQNGGFEVFDGPPDAPGVGFLFPVPEGAKVVDLKIGEDAALELGTEQVGHWGSGVPIRQPIFPIENLLLMGVYRQTVGRGEIFDIGMTALVDTQSLRVALEEGLLTHDASTASEWDVAPLPGGELQTMQDVGRTLRNFQSAPLRAHTEIRVPVRFGPPRVSSRTIVMTLLIALCFLVPVLGGIQLARRRGGSAADERAAELRALHRTGELTDEDLERELARLGAGESKILARLDEMAARSEASPGAVAKDLRDLARIVRDHLREGTR